MTPKPLPFYGSTAKRLIEVHKGEGTLVNLREQEWRESVQWLREELCSCGIGSGQGDCYTCKAIEKAFVGGKE